MILAVNGRSLQGVSHSEAVNQLKKAGSTVVLRIKPNQVLEGELVMQLVVQSYSYKQLCYVIDNYIDMITVYNTLSI